MLPGAGIPAMPSSSFRRQDKEPCPRLRAESISKRPAVFDGKRAHSRSSGTYSLSSSDASVAFVLGSASITAGSAATSTLFLLLNRAEARTLLGSRVACVSSSSKLSVFLLGEPPRESMHVTRLSIVALALEKASAVSSTDQLHRNLSSCSGARQSGHLPSLDSARRIQREQKVWEHDVIMGVLKKSLHTWQRRAASTEARQDRGVDNQSVESAILSADISRELAGALTGEKYATVVATVGIDDYRNRGLDLAVMDALQLMLVKCWLLFLPAKRAPSQE